MSGSLFTRTFSWPLFPPLILLVLALLEGPTVIGGFLLGVAVSMAVGVLGEPGQ